LISLGQPGRQTIALVVIPSSHLVAVVLAVVVFPLVIVIVAVVLAMAVLVGQRRTS
jgi:hypothetical protein